MKKVNLLVILSVLTLVSCSRKIIHPTKTLAQVCRDSFPCKFDTTRLILHDTLHLVSVDTLIKLDTVVKDSIQTVRQLQTITKFRDRILTKTEVITVIDSSTNQAFRDDVIARDNLIKEVEKVAVKANNQVEIEKKSKKTMWWILALSWLLLIAMAILLGKFLKK